MGSLSFTMGITDPADEHFKNGLWGWVTNTWKKLIGDAAGHLQVDVVESGLPTGGATAANQATIITAVENLEALLGPLNDVGADELRVISAQYGSAWKIPRADVDGRLIAKVGIDGTTPEMLNVDSAGTLAVTPAHYGAAWKTLWLDVNNNLRVRIDAQNIDVEVKQQTPGDLMPGIHGWDGSAWHKLPLLFGYSDRWVENVDGTATDTGDATAVSANVDPGYIYVVQALCLFHNAVANKEIHIFLKSNALNVTMYQVLDAIPSTRYVWTGVVLLKEGDSIRGRATAPGSGKQVWLEIWGYKMKIAE